MSTLATPVATLQDRWISTPDGRLSSDFDRKHFEFEHTLAGHPLLEIPHLLEFAERTVKSRPTGVYYDLGIDRIDQRWDEVPARQFSVLESMERLETCGAWFLFKRVQEDPEYRVFLGEGWEKVKAEIGGDLASHIRREDVLIFISSPRRITPYHIDRECSFLLQIQGTKKIHVFDREDREVLSEEEIEKFWSVDKNGPTYRPHLQGRATTYTLRPGTGVHIPVNCPHWVENDDNVSVSLNVNVQFKDVDRANVYRANYLLRRFGMKPLPPGTSPTLDHLKGLSMVPVMAAKPLLRPLKGMLRK
jgi:hypothetical protein